MQLRERNQCAAEHPEKILFCSHGKGHGGLHLAYKNHDLTSQLMGAWSSSGNVLNVDLHRDTEIVVPKEIRCLELHPSHTGWSCSRDKNHFGPHRAHKFHNLKVTAQYEWESGLYGIAASSTSSSTYNEALTTPKLDSLESTMPTVKTYKISALKSIVKNYNTAVAELDEVIADHNTDQEQIVIDRIVSYVQHGTFQNEEGETVDDSVLSLQERLSKLERAGYDRRYAPLLVRVESHTFGYISNSDLAQLDALSGATVEMENTEVDRFLRLEDAIDDVNKTKEKYQ